MFTYERKVTVEGNENSIITLVDLINEDFLNIFRFLFRNRVGNKKLIFRFLRLYLSILLQLLLKLVIETLDIFQKLLQIIFLKFHQKKKITTTKTTKSTKCTRKTSTSTKTISKHSSQINTKRQKLKKKNHQNQKKTILVLILIMQR